MSDASLVKRIREIAAEWHERRERALTKWLTEGAPWEGVEADE